MSSHEPPPLLALRPPLVRVAAPRRATRLLALWGGAMIYPRIVDLRVAYEDRVIREDGCWGWSGSIHRSGYATLAYQTPSGKRCHVQVRRLAYELFVGPILGDVFVKQTCRNRGCVNPNHIEIGGAKHGTPYMYRCGCRCDACRKAAVDYGRESGRRRREAVMAAGGLPQADSRHGTRAGYNAGCRCEGCRSANAEHERTRTAKRRGRNTGAPRPPRVAPLTPEERREKDRARQNAYRKTPQGKMFALARLRRYQARKMAADHGCVTGETYLSLLTMPCVYCGATSKQADHITPLSKGGLHCVDNLAPSCATCNQEKGAKILDTPPTAPLACHLVESARAA